MIIEKFFHSFVKCVHFFKMINFISLRKFPPMSFSFDVDCIYFFKSLGDISIVNSIYFTHLPQQSCKKKSTEKKKPLGDDDKWIWITLGKSIARVKYHLECVSLKIYRYNHVTFKSRSFNYFFFLSLFLRYSLSSFLRYSHSLSLSFWSEPKSIVV